MQLPAFCAHLYALTLWLTYVGAWQLFVPDCRRLEANIYTVSLWCGGHANLGSIYRTLCMSGLKATEAASKGSPCRPHHLPPKITNPLLSSRHVAIRGSVHQSPRPNSHEMGPKSTTPPRPVHVLRFLATCLFKTPGRRKKFPCLGIPSLCGSQRPPAPSCTILHWSSYSTPTMETSFGDILGLSGLSVHSERW